MVQNVFTVTDFDSLLDNYFGRQINHTVISKAIDNLSGEETLTEGVTSAIKCFFIRYMQGWDYRKMGFKEQGDAIALTKYGDSVQLNDILTVDGRKYRVKERFDVPGVFDSTGAGTELVYTVCNLFLAE